MLPRIVPPPDEGLWRIGREPDPLKESVSSASSEVSKASTGNRFDSPTAAYGVRYFATRLEGCFGETLARFRPDPQLASVVGDEWTERGFMSVGDIPADWRQRRTAVKVVLPNPQARFPQNLPFLDIEALETREAIRPHFGELLAFYGYPDLDVPVVRGHDRRITRYISQWAWEQKDDETDLPLYAGIRYLSRLNNEWELWAIFDDVELEIRAKKPILPNDLDLQRVTKTYRLTPY